MLCQFDSWKQVLTAYEPCFRTKAGIYDNLAPVLMCFVIDWNIFEQRSKRAKTVIQTATETTGNGDKRKRTWRVHTQTKRTDICFACELDDIFSGFNTALKAAWLKGLCHLFTAHADYVRIWKTVGQPTIQTLSK